MDKWKMHSPKSKRSLFDQKFDSHESCTTTEYDVSFICQISSKTFANPAIRRFD